MKLKQLLPILFVSIHLFAQQIRLETISTPKNFSNNIAFNSHGEMYSYSCFSKSTIVLNAQWDSLGQLSPNCGIAFGSDRFAVVCGANDKRNIYPNFQLPSPTFTHTIDPLYDTPDSNLLPLAFTPQATVLVNDLNEIYIHYPLMGMNLQTGVSVFKGTMLKKYSSSGALLLKKKFESSSGRIRSVAWRGNELRLRFESQTYNLDGQLNILSHTNFLINTEKYFNLIELSSGGWFGINVSQDSLFWFDSQLNVKATLALSNSQNIKRIFESRSGELYLTSSSTAKVELYKIFLEVVTLQRDDVKEVSQLLKSDDGYRCSEGIYEVHVYDLMGRVERHHSPTFNTLLKGKLVMLAFDTLGNVYRQNFIEF